MRRILIFAVFILVFSVYDNQAQVIISEADGATGNGKAVLDIQSTTKGILIPRMSTTQRGQISLSSSAEGLLVYDNTDHVFYYNASTNTTPDWKSFVISGSSVLTLLSPKTCMTPEGGFAVKMTNKTGSNSVKGTIVEASNTVDNAFMKSTGNSIKPYGVVYEDGVADGSDCWVVVSGVADVLLKDGQSAVHGNVALCSDVAGRMDPTNTDPGSKHDQELGHVLESKSSGTSVLAKVVLHYR